MISTHHIDFSGVTIDTDIIASSSCLIVRDESSGSQLYLYMTREQLIGVADTIDSWLRPERTGDE